MDLITPAGIIKLPESKPYPLRFVFEAKDATLDAFLQALNLPGGSTRRFQILYTLSVNDLLQEVLSETELKMILFLDENPLPGIDLTTAFEFLHKANAQPSPANYLPFVQTFHGNVDLIESGRVKDPIGLRKQLAQDLKDFELTPKGVQRMFEMIDERFLGNTIKFRLRACHQTLTFDVNGRFSKTGGRFTGKSDQNLIELAAWLTDIGDELKREGGEICEGWVECTIATLQHELAHLLVHLETYRLGINREKPKAFVGHGERFVSIVSRLFGISEIYHHLLEEANVDTRASNSAARPKAIISTKSDFQLGDEVSFEGGKMLGYLTGKIVKMNPKRAKVKIGDGRVYLVHYEVLGK